MKLFRLFLLTGFFLFVTSYTPPVITQSKYPRYINRAEKKCFYGEGVQDRRWNGDLLEMCNLPSDWEDNGGVFHDCPIGYTHLHDAAQMQSLCSPWVREYQEKPPFHLNDDTKQCFHGHLPNLSSSFSADKFCVLPEGWTSFYYEPGGHEFVGRSRGKRDSDNRKLTRCPDDYASLSKEAIRQICSWEELRPEALGDGASGDGNSHSKGFGCFGG